MGPELGTAFKNRKRQLLSGSPQIMSSPTLQAGLGLGFQGPGPDCTSMSDGGGQGGADSVGRLEGERLEAEEGKFQKRGGAEEGSSPRWGLKGLESLGKLR